MGTLYSFREYTVLEQIESYIVGEGKAAIMRNQEINAKIGRVIEAEKESPIVPK